MTMRLRNLDELRAHLDVLERSEITTSGTWTAGQIYYHLAAAFEITCAATGGPGGGSRLRKLPLRLWALNVGLPRGVPIPTPVRDRVAPPPEAEPTEQLVRLRRAIDAFESHAGPLPAHPALGPMSRREWTRFHLRHCELHLRHVVAA